jgi:hypothetical protein
MDTIRCSNDSVRSSVRCRSSLSSRAYMLKMSTLSVDLLQQLANILTSTS